MGEGIQLRCTDQGKGVALVLLHGFPLNRTIWDGQQLLSDRYRIITPDLRGHGESPAPPGDYSMEAMAQDVLDLLDRLQVERAILMGHSMGGYVTLAAWAMAPARFFALGLIDTQAGADTDEARANRRRLAEKVGVEGTKVLDAAMSLKLFAPGVSEASPLLKRVRGIIQHSSVRGIQGSLLGMAARPDRTSELAAITVPVLVMTGVADQLIAPTKAEVLATTIPAAYFVPVQDAGHLPMLEQSSATTLALRGFLEKLKV